MTCFHSGSASAACGATPDARSLLRARVDCVASAASGWKPCGALRGNRSRRRMTRTDSTGLDPVLLVSRIVAPCDDSRGGAGPTPRPAEADRVRATPPALWDL